MTTLRYSLGEAIDISMEARAAGRDEGRVAGLREAAEIIQQIIDGKRGSLLHGDSRVNHKHAILCRANALEAEL